MGGIGWKGFFCLSVFRRKNDFFFLTLLARRWTCGMTQSPSYYTGDSRSQRGRPLSVCPLLYTPRVQSRGSRANKRVRDMRGGASANYRKKWAQSAGHLCLLADDVCFPPFILSVVPGHSTRWLSLMQKFRFYSFLFVFCFFSSPVCSGSLDETGTFKKWRGEVNSAQKEIEFRNFRLSDQFARIEKEKKKKKKSQSQTTRKSKGRKAKRIGHSEPSWNRRQ